MGETDYTEANARYAHLGQMVKERDEARAENERLRAQWEYFQKLASEEHDRNVAEIERLRAALTQIRDHPEQYRDRETAYSVGWAFRNVQGIARAALAKTGGDNG